jgi:hypothetical protein
MASASRHEERGNHGPRDPAGEIAGRKGRRALGRFRQLEPEAKSLPGQGMVQG